jgi:putative DNA primase/helicase
MARAGEWQFPRVSAIIATPTMRPDGSIMAEAGYDPATQLYLAPSHGLSLPQISNKPTRDEAVEALACLNGLIQEFDFVSEIDKSVAFSLLITPVVRAALDVAPMHMISAPTYGSGKTYLMNIATAIATGEACPVTSAGRDEAELEKRIDAALLKCQPIIGIDNVNGILFSNKLAVAIEQRLIDVRPLGTSTTVQIENKGCFPATGCNISVRSDMARRTLSRFLDPNIERPESREFKHNPFQDVLADRGKYIAAAMTIARAYQAAGEPAVDAKRLASFDAWSRFVQRPLIWLGCADPAKSVEANEAADPEIGNLQAVLSAWHDAHGDEELTVKELAASTHEALREAMLEIAPGKDGALDTNRLGKWLPRMNGRIAGGIKLERCSDKDTHRKASKWKVTGRGRGNQFAEQAGLAEHFSSTCGQDGREKKKECQKGVEGLKTAHFAPLAPQS